MKFETAIGHILKKEGGYVNNPNDKGGETKFGISRRSYPALDIKNLTIAQATAIYKKDFWDTIKADQLPEKIRLHAFDVSVNSGPTAAIIMIQSIAGVKTDGNIGPITIAKAKSITPWQFSAARIKKYCGIVKSDRSQLVFIEGWLMRNQSITEICLTP